MAGNLFQSIISLTDTLFMGRVGEDQLAACGISSMFYVVMSMIGYSMAIGGQILIARRAGSEDINAIGRISRNLLYILGALGVLFYLFISLGSPVLLQYMFHSESVFKYSIEYLQYRAYGAVPIFMVFALGGFYMGIGETKVIIWSTGSMAIANVLLNYGFIFGHFGLPQLGIRGAGLASMIAELLAFSVVISHLFFHRYPHQFHFFSHLNPDWSTIRQIGKLSAPIVLQTLTGALGWFIFFIMVENYLGKHDLAVSNVLKILYLFFSIPSRGLATGTNTLVSNILGQNKPSLMKLLMIRTSIASIGITAVLIIPVLFFPESTLYFLTNDAHIVHDAVRVLPIILSALLLLSVSAILFRGVTGSGAVGYALRIELIIVVVYLAYAWLIMDRFSLSLGWAWTAEWLYWIILAVGSYLFLAKGSWRKLDI